MRVAFAFILSAFSAALVAAQQSGPNAFNIPPSGNYLLTAGQPTTFTWKPTTSGTITLTLRDGANGNLNPGTVIQSGLANSGSYTYTPPATTVEGNTYTIEISSDSDPSQVNYTPQFDILSSVKAGASSSASVSASASASNSASASASSTAASVSTNAGSTLTTITSSVSGSTISTTATITASSGTSTGTVSSSATGTSTSGTASASASNSASGSTTSRNSASSTGSASPSATTVTSTNAGEGLRVGRLGMGVGAMMMGAVAVLV